MPIRSAPAAAFEAGIFPSYGAPSYYQGANLAGAEFGGGPFFATETELDYYRYKRLNALRIPFTWERVQPTLGAALDATHVVWLELLIARAEANQTAVVLDVHNYGRRGGVIGSDGASNDQFADFWSRLATQFKGHANVIWGLMNEPHDQDTSAWLISAQAAVNAIRATGSAHLILVPGASFTGAHTWVSSGNAAIMSGIVDTNFAFEVHSYFDSDNSGSSAAAVSETIGAERLAIFTNWARPLGYRGWLGEFGAASNATMLAALGNTIDHMKANRDVWLGWTYWAGGPAWGNYMYSCEPSAGVDAAQMTTIAAHL